MSKRGISLLLCLMMVVSLFAGTMTSANAASIGFSVDPKTDTIYGTGSAEFTVKTILDSLMDAMNGEKSFELKDFIAGLSADGFDLSQIMDLLGQAGFNWEDIIGSLKEKGFDIDSIAGVLKGMLENGDVSFLDMLNDFKLDSGLLESVLTALNNQGLDLSQLNLDPALLQQVLDAIKGINASDLSGVISGLIGKISGGAGPLSTADEPSVDEPVDTDAPDSVNIDKLLEALGKYFPAETVEQIRAALEGLGEQVSLSDALKAISDTFGVNLDEETLQKAVQAINDAMGGNLDLEALAKSVVEQVGSQLPIEDMLGAINDALGSELTTDQIKDVINGFADGLKNGEDFGDLVKALVDEYAGDMDLEELLKNVVSAMDLEGKLPPMEDLVNAVNEALGTELDPAQIKDVISGLIEGVQNGEDIGDLISALTEEYKDKLDLEELVKTITESLSENDKLPSIDELVSSINEALGAELDPEQIKDVINGFVEGLQNGEDFSELVKALVEQYQGEMDLEELLNTVISKLNEDGKLPSLDELLAAITEALGTDMTPEELKAVVNSVIESLKNDESLSDIVSALAEQYKDQFTLDQLLETLKNALGEDFENSLNDIIKSLLGENYDLNAIVEALKNLDFENLDITEILFGEAVNLKYSWMVRTTVGSKMVSRANDRNTYAGDKEKTLTVTREKAPKNNETYTYFCMVSGDIAGKELGNNLESPDAVLKIVVDSTEPTTSPDPTATTQPTTPPEEGPTLNNINHTAYIDGYEDGTVKPNQAINRAEAAQILFKLMTAASRTKYTTTVNLFPDVNAGDWFNTAVSTLARASVIEGYEDGTYKPYAPITRAELATMLTRLNVADPISKPGTAKVFPDVGRHWAAPYIMVASANGWIDGYEDGTFKPDNSITRAETVTMINRMLSRNPDPEQLKDMAGMTVFTDNADTSKWYYAQIQEAANDHTFERGNDGVEVWTGIVK